MHCRLLLSPPTSFPGFEYCHIKRTVTEVIDLIGSRIILTVCKLIGEGSSSWIVEDTENIQTSNLSCILYSITLLLCEVRRYRNNNFGPVLELIAINMD